MIKKASYNLSKNLLTSLSLSLITFLTYLIFCLGFEIFIVLIRQILINYSFEKFAQVLEKNALYINLLGMIFIISPLNLSVKNWYYSEGQKNLLQAFVVFSSISNYLKAIVFCFIKTLYLTVNTIMLLLPIAFVTAIFKFMNTTNDYSNAITIIVFFIVMILLFSGLIACLLNFTIFLSIDNVFLYNMNTKNKINLWLNNKIL